MAIRWIFFDIGDVLFDENVPHLYYFHSLLLAMRRNGVEVEWDDYRTRIDSCVRRTPATAPLDAAREFVPDPELWNRVFREARAEYQRMREPRPYGLLLNDITAVVRTLREEFSLGIIANQHPPILQALEDYGIGRYFDVKAIDEVIGLTKPDPAIFRWALDKADCPAEEALMIGDRPDHDILPAKALGMRTLRFRRGLLYALYDEQSDAERAEVVVRDVSGLVAAVHRLVGEGSR